MIRISQSEFSEKIREVIRGEKTLIGLCKELQTDERTLVKNIILHSTYDPEVYSEFVEARPYRTREREDIDFEALAIKILKQGMNSIQAAQEYKVSVRTIQRKVNKIKETNPELYRIYKEAKEDNKRDRNHSYELTQQIDMLVERPVIIGEINGKTERKLEEIEAIYNERMEIYSTKEEAARSMGMTPNRLYKLLNQLYRIKIEKIQRNRNEFKKGLEVNGVSEVHHTHKQELHEEKEIEGEEK